MTFIILFGLVSSLLAVLVLGLVIVYIWTQGIYGRSRQKARARKIEEIRHWAEEQAAHRPEDEETWHRNQDMKMD